MRFAVAAVAVLLVSHSALAAEEHAAEGHAASGHADHYCVEVSGGTSAALKFSTGDSKKTTWLLDAEIAAPVYEELVDLALDLSLESTDATLTNERRTDVTPVLGLQLNLGDPNPRDSFFLFGGAGFTLASESGHTETEFTYRFKGGKRFSLVSSVSYAPFVEYTKTNTLDGVISIVPLAFSLFL